MSELKEILDKLERMEGRLDKLEGKKTEKECRQSKAPFVDPKDLEMGHFTYAGRYKSLDGSMESTFGASDVWIANLLECNSFEMAKVIDAFSSEDRINIIKELIQRCMTAKQLMDKLNFQTTGKLYHHLSFLEKIGVIRKDGEEYHVSARYISCVILIAMGVERIISKNNNRD